MKLKALIPLLLFAALGTAFAAGLNKDPSVLPSQLINKPFPEFSLTRLSSVDEIITREAVLGQVSLVNVFGSWCVACADEHPTLMRLARDKEIPIIGIDWRDTRAKANAWLARRGNPYGQIIFDPDSVLAIDLGITGAPESFIVDKKGNVRYKFTGIITEKIWAKKIKPVVILLEAEQ